MRPPMGGQTDRRVVVLIARGGDPLPRTVPGVEPVRVPTAYEAFAEVLAAPTDALVVDLGALAARHGRLIARVRELGVEIFAVGAGRAGLDAETLSGVRLASRAELPALLEAHLHTAAEPEPDEPEGGAAQTHPARSEPAGGAEARPPQPVRREPPGPEAKAEPAKPAGPEPSGNERGAQRRREAPGDGDEGAYIAERRRKLTGQREGASALLSPDELAALLENEQ